MGIFQGKQFISFMRMTLVATKTLHSSYWIDANTFADDDTREIDKDRDRVRRLVRLAAVRRAIGNFVNILTGRNDLMVKYTTAKGNSYTDGNTIVIAADDDPTKFDSAVGLALHEAAHVLLSDFSVLHMLSEYSQSYGFGRGLDVRNVSFRSGDKQNMWKTISSQSTDAQVPALVQLLHPSLHHWLPATRDVSSYESIRAYDVALQTVTDILKTLMNLVEDRYIDAYVYQRATGYRPYYDALYSRYFYTAEIGRNLKFNPAWRELTVENYVNRLLFMFHPDAKLDAMPGLENLVQIIDLENISRVGDRSTPWDRLMCSTTDHTACLGYADMPKLWQVANELLCEILTHTGLPTYEEAPPSSSTNGAASSPSSSTTQSAEQTDGTAESSTDASDNATTEDSSDADGTADEADGDNSDNTPRPVETGKNGKPGKFNAAAAAKQIAAAQSVVKNAVKKRKVTAQEAQSINAIELAKGSIEEIQGHGIPKTDVMVTRRVTDELFTQPWFIFGNAWAIETRSDGTRHLAPTSTAATEKNLILGRRLGELLVHRLQVRNDPLVTKTTRLPAGGIDRRQLAQLGMELTNIFQKTRVDMFKPALVHFSIDASASMGGNKWGKTQILATAIAYVGSRMRNIDTVISVRAAHGNALISIIFDSRVDKYARFVRYFRHIRPSGGTPEGLCFHAIKDMLLRDAAGYDMYFVNISDGEPCFAPGGKHPLQYWGPVAHKHTRAMVEMFRSHGIKVLSYFISERNMNGYADAFRTMYGEDAAFIDVANATSVLRTLNQRLLAKG
jgi:hypothetical protein